MPNEPEKWRWQDYVALVVCVVWAVSYLAGLWIDGYMVPVEVSFAMLAVMGALGFTTPPDPPKS